jgi:VCBS repeat-containing protein
VSTVRPWDACRFLDTDPEGDALTATLVAQPQNGTVTLETTGAFTYTPNANFNGPDEFTYTASDGTDTNTPVTATVSIEVTPVNDAPVANNDSFGTAEDTTLTVNLPDGVLSNDTDVDGDTLRARLDDLPASGRVSLSADGAFIYTPNPNFNGTDTFTYTVTDTAGSISEPATVTVLVAPVHDAPVAKEDRYDALEDTQLKMTAGPSKENV